MLKKAVNVKRQAHDLFSPRKLAIVTYTDVSEKQIKTVVLMKPELKSEQGGVFAVITHAHGKLLIESQHLHVYEEKAWNRADYTDALDQVDLDGPDDDEPKVNHHRLAAGGW